MNPLVSIIVPTHNNESTVIRTLNSLIEQTLRSIEIIVVDDASTDATVALCREVATMDSRISVLTLDENASALQTRRIGVEHAVGTYIMFCDSDDQLTTHAAEEAAAFAMGGGYEVVHFSTNIISATGSKHPAWEKSLDPFGAELFGDDIMRNSAFGRPSEPINGHIWNKLYDRSLIMKAWDSIDPSLRLPRAQDVYQTLLILTHAKRYGGLRSPLYQYNFRAGKSGNVATREAFQHFLTATRTYEAVKEYLESDRWEAPDGLDNRKLLDRLRDQFIGNQLNYWFQLPQPAPDALGDVLNIWGAPNVVRVLAEQFPGKARNINEAFNLLHAYTSPQGPQIDAPNQRSPRIALLGNISGNGGVQKVIATQAALLSRAGYTVYILAFDHEPDELVQDLPAAVELRKIGPRGEARSTIMGLLDALVEERIDLLLNHDNYSPLMPWTSFVSHALEVKSSLFLHSFSLRGLLDFRANFADLPTIAQGYDTTVTLSTADRMWWEASGVKNVRTLPNFAPPVLDQVPHPAATDLEPEVATYSSEEASGPSTDLLWVGRLQDETKNISGLLRAFALIINLRPQTTLTIVGDEQNSGELARLQQLAQQLGVHESVHFAGATLDVASWYRSAKLFVSTASIEGFNLTLVEAQSSGLPAIIYELAYLETVRGNPGIVTVPWGSSTRFATETVALLSDAERRKDLATAGKAFALKFSLDRYEHRLLEFVQDLLIGKTSPTPAIRNEPLANEDSVPVPRAVIGELYRLYQRMHERTNSQLRKARNENTSLRKDLAQLRRSLEGARSAQTHLEDSISRIEGRKPIAPRKETRQGRQRTMDPIGGVWPLWARQKNLALSPPSSSPFSDLSPDDKAYLPALWAIDIGLLQSIDTPNLNGDRRITRVEFIHMLHRLAGSPPGSLDQQVFGDSDADDPAVFWALGRGLMKRPQRHKGDELPRWDASSSLTRRAAARYLYRAAGRPVYAAPRTSPYSDLTVNQGFYKEICWSAHQAVLPARRLNSGDLVFQEFRAVTLAEGLTALYAQLVGPVAKQETR